MSNIFTTLVIILGVLKIFHVIQISWFGVFAPWLILLGLWIVFFVIVAIFMLIANLLKWRART